MINNILQPRPLFVLGSPRSGTTMIGEYIASHPNVLSLGEYGGFDFTYRLAQNELKGMPSQYVEKYLDELKLHARDFPQKLAIEQEKEWFSDAAPWNLLSAEEIDQRNPDSIYLLCYRNIQGVTQSLEKSFSQGWDWAGKDFNKRVLLWKNFYKNIISLPPEKTIYFNYDMFCQYPLEILDNLDKDLKEKTQLELEFNRNIFAESHASGPEKKGNTIASFSEEKKIIFNSIASYNKENWLPEYDTYLSEDMEYQFIQSYAKARMRKIII